MPRKVAKTPTGVLPPYEDLQAGAIEAMDEGVQRGDGQTEVAESEQKAVQAAVDEYNGARAFDESARRQYHRDRKYAAGKSDKAWKSNANIIGSHIDILKSFIYAQNPDVSCRPGEKVDQQITEDEQAFAQTMQIVISKLWKRAKLKKRARRQTAATLTTGNGVLKALMYTDKRPNPQLEKQLKDSQDNLARVQQLEIELSEGEFDSDESKNAKIVELQNQIKGLAAKVEKLNVKGLCVDMVRSEDFQCSLDVASITDHLEADWNSDDLYIRKDQLRTRFPRLTAADVKSAVTYYQSAPKTEVSSVIITQETRADDPISADGAFTKAKPGQSSTGLTQENGKPVEFARVTEMWCRNENIIKTFVDGVKRWAFEPYAPPHGSNRFYPYFSLAFYEVDGERHPHSLVERELKLQDEYASRRSNGAEVRERSVPAKIINGGMLAPEEVEKIRTAKNQEFVVVRPTDSTAKVDQLVGVIAAPRIDYMAYATDDVERDMEKVSGVNEAQQQSPKPGVTATAVETSNQGFASRSGADRDAIEDMLTDLAVYTGETSLQALSVQDVERLAGTACYWPGSNDLTGEPGMDYEDLAEMLDIEIVAGSTGKPQARADKETWATLLPLVQQDIATILQLESTGVPAAMAQAKAMRALLRETLKRMDDRMSLDQILPPPVAPLIPPAAPGATASDAGLPPPEGAAGGNPTDLPPGPPVGNGTVNNPQSAPPTA